MTRKPLFHGLYSVKEYIEESKQEETQGTAVRLIRPDMRSGNIRFQHSMLSDENPARLKFSLSLDTEMEFESRQSALPRKRWFAPRIPKALKKITEHFILTSCHASELHALYLLERKRYKGPLLILGHAREIERELKHNLFLSAPSMLHDEVSDYFDRQDPERFSFMIEALAGNAPITLGIIECWLRALGHLQDERAMQLHPANELLNDNRMYLLTREPSIQKMYRFRKLRNAATHDDIAEGQVDEFFQVTYSLPSFRRWVDDDFKIPETVSAGFFSDYLSSGHRPLGPRL